MFDDELKRQAESLLQRCRDRQLKIATAESCTGGLIIGLLTEIPGSSDVVDRGFITYSNQAKMQMLGVADDMLKLFGAVSEPVAQAMAVGAIEHSDAQLSVAVTGIAGPDGGSDEKPVGTVYFAAANPKGVGLFDKQVFEGTRSDVRLATVAHAVHMLNEVL